MILPQIFNFTYLSDCSPLSNLSPKGTLAAFAVTILALGILSKKAIECGADWRARRQVAQLNAWKEFLSGIKRDAAEIRESLSERDKDLLKEILQES